MRITNKVGLLPLYFYFMTTCEYSINRPRTLSHLTPPLSSTCNPKAHDTSLPYLSLRLRFPRNPNSIHLQVSSCLEHSCPLRIWFASMKVRLRPGHCSVANPRCNSVQRLNPIHLCGPGTGVRTADVQRIFPVFHSRQNLTVRTDC